MKMSQTEKRNGFYTDWIGLSKIFWGDGEGVRRVKGSHFLAEDYEQYIGKHCGELAGDLLMQHLLEVFFNVNVDAGGAYLNNLRYQLLFTDLSLLGVPEVGFCRAVAEAFLEAPASDN